MRLQPQGVGARLRERHAHEALSHGRDGRLAARGGRTGSVAATHLHEAETLMIRRLSFPLVCTALVLALGHTASAQVPTTTVGGRVTDPQQAPAAGATVTVRSEATGITWTATTGSDGRFTVPMLPPGVYTAEVQKSGFSTWRTAGIV